MRRITARQLDDTLMMNGWEFKRQKGSHRTYSKNGIPYIISFPYHSANEEVSRPMAQRLLRQAGIES
jgi:predicted RNA binding protein YcfA (HicA-like mRNA interferase family)